MGVLRRLLFLPPVVAGAALMAYAVSNRSAPEAATPTERSTPVSYVAVTPRSFVPRVSGFGAVTPARTWEAVAQVRGRITEVSPDFIRGGTVQEGDVLVRIARDDYELAVAQARAKIESAAASIEEMRLTRETTRRSLEIERRAYDLATRELDRQKDLAGRGAVSASTVDAQQTKVLAQQAKVQQLENQLSLMPAQIKALEQSKAVSEAALKIAQLDLERTVVSAPFDARVSRADVEISQFVNVGAKMGALDGLDAAEIDVQIPPDRMAAFGRLAFEGGARPPDRQGNGPAGLTAHVTLGYPPEAKGWEAEVKRISDTVDPETRSIGVIVSVPDPYGQMEAGVRPPLIKGMFVKVELRAPPVAGLVLLPRSAIRDGRVMLAGPDDRLAFADAAPVYTLGDIAVLASGALPDGARVVTSDLTPAVAGMLLTPEADAEEEAALAAAGEGG